MAAPGDRGLRAVRLALWMLAVVCVAPALVFLSVVGVRTGGLDWQTGYQTLTMTWAWRAAMVGAAAALVAIWCGLRAPRRAGGWALAAAAISAGTLWVFAQALAGTSSAAPAADVTSNRADPPGFARMIEAQRQADDAVPTSRGPGVDDRCANAGSIPSQASPEAASVALQRAGFTVLGRGVGRSDGSREGFWFGRTHDAAIRIRPGQTDVRIASREPGPDAGQACRLLNEILAELQAMR